MNKAHNYAVNFSKIQEYVSSYSILNEVLGLDTQLIMSIEDYRIEHAITKLLGNYENLIQYSRDIVSFASYYKVMWDLYHMVINESEAPVWEAEALDDFIELSSFLEHNELNGIRFYSKDLKNADRSHMIKNPFVIHEVNLLIKDFFQVQLPKKKGVYFQAKKITQLMKAEFPQKKNVDRLFNESMIFLARFLRGETYMKDEPKNEIYRFLGDFCMAINIKSTPANFEDYKKYIDI